MKASEAKLLTLLEKASRFIIPIYQRTYSWTEKQCHQLWDDIIRAGSSENVAVHFIGSIVYVEQGLGGATFKTPLLVIDGQQRLTTITLLLEALARILGDTEPVDGFSSAKVRHYYLTNPLEKDERYFKLTLSQTDDASLKAIIKNSEPPRDPSLRITQNFALFTQWLKEYKHDLTPICRGLAKLMVVDIALNREHDNPQLIFESMNSTGKELSQADLIRNFILMGLEPELQSRLYEDYWRPMELDFGQDAYGMQFDSFMRYYLIVRTGSIPLEREVYEKFKDYSRTNDVKQAGIEALVKDIRTFARYFCAMALGAEKEEKLNKAFHDLRELKVDVAYPFLLEVYHDYANQLLDVIDFEKIVRLIESYVFRRAICSIPTNSMNKTFATFGKLTQKENYLESVQANFLLLPSYRRFPTDEEFQRDIRTRDLYNFRSRSYWLRRLENDKRKELVLVNDYTIEHILPQNPNLSDNWKQMLGSEWERIQKQWLHTLGNLTLTAYNKEYSDRPFLEKRDMPNDPLKGLKHSPLLLNAGLGQLEAWNEETIKMRAERLANMALTVWESPKLDAKVLANYQPTQEPPPAGYGINDHPYLLNPALREVFEAFRQEVLALDPGVVTEEFLKLYVAYKAETNFVDLVPQAKRLRLSLNIPFVDVNDPQGMCKDVTNLGRWGNGDVEIGLKTLDEIPYVMSLVRQAFERQMDGGGQL